MQRQDRYATFEEVPVIMCVSFDCPRHGRVTFDNRAIPASTVRHTDPWAEYHVSQARRRDTENEQKRWPLDRLPRRALKYAS